MGASGKGGAVSDRPQVHVGLDDESGPLSPDRQRVHMGPADESKRTKRADARSRGFQSSLARAENDLANASAELREEIEAADQAALNAALDAAAAQDGADAALFEAQFGNIAVGRLLTGSVQVDRSISSTGFEPGSSGWRIRGDGDAEFNNVTIRGTLDGVSGTFSGSLSGASGTFGGSITGGSISIGSGGAAFNVSSGGRMWAQKMYRASTGNDAIGFAFTSATGWYIDMVSPGHALLNGSTVWTDAVNGAPSGSRTTDGINWIGASGGPNGVTSFATAGGDSHRHDVQFHTHTITI